MWKGFQKPKRLAPELESLTEKYARFSAQPFERGWGTTVGNALMGLLQAPGRIASRSERARSRQSRLGSRASTPAVTSSANPPNRVHGNTSFVPTARSR